MSVSTIHIPAFAGTSPRLRGDKPIRKEETEMAKRIQAINAYRPRINLRPTVQRRQLVSYISDRTGVNEGEF